MSNSLLRIVCAVLLCSAMCTAKAGTTNCENHTDSVYLFCYATNNPKDGAHFAYSYDKHRWTALGGNHSFFKSDFGTWGVLKNMFTPSFTQDERVNGMPCSDWERKSISLLQPAPRICGCGNLRTILTLRRVNLSAIRFLSTTRAYLNCISSRILEQNAR